VVGGALSVGCKSDASVICGKLYACHLLHDEAPTKDNPQGFTEDVCKSQVESELGDSQQERCADCTDTAACGEVQSKCRADCEAVYPGAPPAAAQ
ncbi:MAG TPA: hypothetical protein VGQ57_10495, partial [Polyangiaceae bacterium]|nr:hypothetical protein [Polyangiaceae bacterium]